MRNDYIREDRTMSGTNYQQVGSSNEPKGTNAAGTDSTLSSRRVRRSVIIVAAALSALLFLIVGLYISRFALWHGYPKLRPFVRPILLVDPTLCYATKTEVRHLLGPPDITERRYCWIPRELVGGSMTGDLVFRIDDSNKLARVHFLYGDWKPTRTLPMDLEAWKDQSEADRWAMNADLVQRWPKGDFRGRLETVNDVLKYFPAAIFIDYWQYASDGEDGIGGSLGFMFEPDGSVREVTAGYID